MSNEQQGREPIGPNGPGPDDRGGVAAHGVATLALPRELILASAGSGKTFRISSRIIGLLAHGEPAEAILASTFTRKAAGEILGRVLVRLAEAALDDEKARELAGHIALEGGATPSFDSGRALEILASVVRQLHRLNIATLDAFFVRTAQTFAAEIGLPQGWGIGDEPTAARLRSEALQQVLREGRTGELVELVRLINRDALPRSVHESLLQRVADLHALHHQIDPEAPDPWSAFPDLPAAPTHAGGDPRLAEAIAEIPLPTTRSGTPRRHWATALPRAAEAIAAGDWEAFIKNPISQRILDGILHYDHEEIDGEILRIFEEAQEVAKEALRRQIDAQSRAMGRLVAQYDEAVAELQRREGVYRFEDLTRLLGGSTPVAARPDLYYRLDARLRHLLLDEFQDTSATQWAALEPLADELLGIRGTRAASIVADPKQSIYGWRGAAPGLVYDVGERYELERDILARSWRSSQVVLDLVNAVFSDIEANPALREEQDQDTAADWARAFSRHEAARDLPGYVSISVGPEDPGRGNHRPRLLAHTAALVRDLHLEAPGRSIGVLTRENKAVARLIHELRRLGIMASEEGGNPLTDSAPVTAILALLRLADHPDDRIARYHVARTPLGEVVGYTEPGDAAAAQSLAHRTRQRLLDDGYGVTLSALATALRPSCDAREERRLTQLVELAFRHDARAGLRPTDFVRLVETERVEDPTTAAVRVMTVHQSKGLEFDIVVLPELDQPIFKSGGAPALPLRESETGPITRVFPYVSKTIRPLFEEIQKAYLQSRVPVLRDALSGLYVALTRARHALYIVIKPDGKSGPGTALTPARIVREALIPGVPAFEWDALYQAGDPRWFEAPGGVATPQAAVDDDVAPLLSVDPDRQVDPALREGPLLREDSPRRRRILPRRKPSDLEGGARVDLRQLLRLDVARSLERGSVVHAWCQEIGWIEDGTPADERLHAIAHRIAPTMTPAEVDALIVEFRAWLAAPPIVAALSRVSYPPGARLENETPFAYRDGDTVVEGIIDRLVVWGEEEGGEVSGAEVLDFKTDAVSATDTAAIDQRAEFYRPQLGAYRDAVATIFRVPQDRVRARLLFLRAGEVREV